MSTNEDLGLAMTTDLSSPVSWSELTGEPVAVLLNEKPSSSQNAFAATYSWHHLAGKPDILPHYETRVKSILKVRLGYIPTANALIPYEPFLRAIAQAYDHGQMDVSAYDAEVEELVRQIRNKDILMFDAIPLPRKDYEEYEKRKNTFSGLLVRQRLTRFLDQVPELRHSLQAELMMQQIVDEGIVKFADRPNETDIRALTIIGYRMALLSEGKQAADNSPLWYYDFAMDNGYFEEMPPPENGKSKQI